MPHTVTAGLDGSPKSRTAAESAAREAEMRGLRLTLVHVREPEPDRVEAPRPCHRVIGSIVGTRQAPDEVFRPPAAGCSRVVSPSRPSASADASFQDVPHGQIDARTVFEFPDGR
ncbi:universal stress protein [Streptomyces albiflavescens]|nr:universal stress protein [Streptomyces albiflavescens]